MGEMTENLISPNILVENSHEPKQNYLKTVKSGRTQIFTLVRFSSL